MRRYIMKYLGTPIAKVVEMTREEFLQLYPRTPIVMSNLLTGEVLESFEVAPDSIQCDFCSKDPGQTVWVYSLRSIVRGYCTECAQRSWIPHCVEVV